MNHTKEAEEIAKKYVFGNHDALTDSQEVKDMAKEIDSLVASKIKHLQEENDTLKARELGFIQSMSNIEEENQRLKGKTNFDEVEVLKGEIDKLKQQADWMYESGKGVLEGVIDLLPEQKRLKKALSNYKKHENEGHNK